MQALAARAGFRPLVVGSRRVNRPNVCHSGLVAAKASTAFRSSAARGLFKTRAALVSARIALRVPICMFTVLLGLRCGGRQHNLALVVFFLVVEDAFLALRL